MNVEPSAHSGGGDFAWWLLGESPATAQNLEAGKPPAQIFSNTCSICHKSSRGLLKTVEPGSLPAFLRQHYTTSTDMASVMSAYVLSNGAALLRGETMTLQGRDAKTSTGGKPSAAPEQGAPSAIIAEPGARQKSAKDSAKDSAKESGKDSGKGKPARPELSHPEPANNNEVKEAKPESMPDTGTETAKVGSPNVSEKDSDIPKAPSAEEAASSPDHPLTIDTGPVPAPVAAQVDEPPLPPAGPPIPPISH